MSTTTPRPGVAKVDYLVDEAGNLSLDAIRGMLMICNKAKDIDYPLSMVFIGMDDLPSKIMKLQHVEKRIDEWCFFEPYDLTDVAVLLGELHPHFANMDLNKSEHAIQIETIYEMTGGFPGLIVPFLKKLLRHQALEA